MTNTYHHVPPGRAPGGQTLRGGSVGGKNPLQKILAGAPVAFALVVIFLVPLGGALKYGVALAGAALLAVGARLLQKRTAAVSAATHLVLRANSDEPRRGEELHVTLSVSDPSAAERQRLEVGLTCIERWDYRNQSRSSSSVGSARTQSRRVTSSDTVFEEWVPAERSSVGESITFRIPPDAPFSHEGDCLSFSWMLSAREHVERGIDNVLDHPIWVRP